MLSFLLEMGGEINKESDVPLEPIHAAVFVVGVFLEMLSQPELALLVAAVVLDYLLRM